MVKKRLKQPGDMTTVRQYRHFDELLSCLQSGWSAPTVHAYLVERHGDKVPHEKAIQRWRNNHMPEGSMIVPHQIITRKLKGVDYKVDVIRHLSRLIAICEDRMARGIDSEETDFGGMPVSGTDGVIQTYLQAMAQYVRVAQDLGLMKARPQVPLIDARTLNVTPETLRALQDTVREIKLIEQGGIDG